MSNSTEIYGMLPVFLFGQVVGEIDSEVIAIEQTIAALVKLGVPPIEASDSLKDVRCEKGECLVDFTYSDSDTTANSISNVIGHIDDVIYDSNIHPDVIHLNKSRRLTLASNGGTIRTKRIRSLASTDCPTPTCNDDTDFPLIRRGDTSFISHRCVPATDPSALIADMHPLSFHALNTNLRYIDYTANAVDSCAVLSISNVIHDLG